MKIKGTSVKYSAYLIVPICCFFYLGKPKNKEKCDSTILLLLLSFTANS